MKHWLDDTNWIDEMANEPLMVAPEGPRGWIRPTAIQ